MKIIVKQAVNSFSGRKKDAPALNDAVIVDFIKSHAFFDSALPCDHMLREIKEKIKEEDKPQNQEIQRKLQQLSLYLKR